VSRLPTPEQAKKNARALRAKLRSEAKALKQREYEERAECRRILFGLANGKHGNIKSSKLRNFISMVKHRSYDRYLYRLANPDYNPWNQGSKWRHALRTTPEKPLTYRMWIKIWWANNRKRYRIEIERQAKVKWEAMQDAKQRDTAMQKLEGRGMLEVGCEISERERRSLDLPVSNLPAAPSGVEGRDSRP
jgi:hypothetical protein